MLRGRTWVVGLAVVLLIVVAVVAVACGGATTPTTVAPVTTAAPTTEAPITTVTEAPTTTTAAPTTTTAAPTTTTAAAIDPAALFAANCQGCHKNPPKASLATATKIITSGRQTMPSFKDKLTPAELAAVAQWIANGGK